jgi:hypothetical protein
MSHFNSEYFDLHTTGIGYVNRFREVPLKHGRPFYSVTIAALHGSVDNPDYTKIDCRISGVEALERLRNLESDVNAVTTKVLIGFNIGDIFLPDPFQYKSGDRQGQTACMIKGRLLRVRWAKVKAEGETEYKSVFEQDSIDQEYGIEPLIADTGNSSDTLFSPEPPQDVLPDTVKLNREDPEFERKKHDLKQTGYRWDRTSQRWRLSGQPDQLDS